MKWPQQSPNILDISSVTTLQVWGCWSVLRMALAFEIPSPAAWFMSQNSRDWHYSHLSRDSLPSPSTSEPRGQNFSGRPVFDPLYHVSTVGVIPEHSAWSSQEEYNVEYGVCYKTQIPQIPINVNTHKNMMSTPVKNEELNRNTHNVVWKAVMEILIHIHIPSKN